MARKSNDRLILDTIIEDWSEGLDDDLKPDELLELFSAEQILKDYSSSLEEIENGIVDGTGDGGIDAIYCFINGQLVDDTGQISEVKKGGIIDLFIIQSKNTNGFSGNTIKVLHKNLEELLDLELGPDDYEGEFSDSVTEKVQIFKDSVLSLATKSPKINIYINYASAGNTDSLHTNCSKNAGALEDWLTEQFPDTSAKFIFLGARELIEMHRKSSKEIYKLAISENTVSASSFDGYVTFSSIDEYYNFLKNDDGNLSSNILEENVRDYQGNVEVNKGIKNTLISNSKSEDFWWLNNGITIICSKASVTGKTINIENPYIVNGLQTSIEIFSYKSVNPNNSDNRNVLIRIIPSESEEIRDKIIRATNSQTNIPSTQLRATERIHRDIETTLLSKGYYYERRKNFYRNQGRKRSETISIALLGQAIMSALLLRPSDARARPASLLNRPADYERIFSEKYDITFYSRIAEIERICYDYLKAKNNITRRDRTNIRFHFLMMTVLRATKKTKPKVEDIVAIDATKLKKTFLNSTFKIVKNGYDNTGGDDQAAKGSDLQGHLLSLDPKV